MLALILPLPLASAQEELVSPPMGEDAFSPQPNKWQETVRSLRRQTEMLLEKNKSLNEEYSYLQGSMTEVQAHLKQLETEIEEYRRESRRLLDLQKKNTQEQKDMETKLLQQKRAMEPLEKQNRDLEVQWMAVKQETQQWHDRVTALEQEKRDLIAQLKNLEESKDGMSDAVDEEIKKLDSILQEYEEEGALVELEKDSYKREQEEIARINAMLEDNVEGLKDEEQQVMAQIEGQERQTAELKKKNAPERLPPELVKEKKRLEMQVQHLEGQLETIKKSVEETSAVLEKKRTLMDEIMGIDAENRNLRQQVSDLVKQLKDAKP